MKKYAVLFLLLSILASLAFASSESKALMGQFLHELTELKKFMVSERTFAAPENEVQIALHLREFARLARLARHNPQLNTPNFIFSRQILESHIVDTERVFRSGNKSYARWQLNSTVSVCASCHSQVPTAGRPFAEFGSAKMFSSGFDQAEFLFATKAFDESLALYKKTVSEFPENTLDASQVEIAVQRELAYYLRVKKDPAAAALLLKEHLGNKNLWPGIKTQMNEWIVQLGELAKKPVFSPEGMSNKDLNEYFKKNPLADSDLLTRLQVSGILYEYLNTHPQSPLTPDILYWLSVCDRQIGHNFFFSLADMYLRECMTIFTARPVAEKCYALYEEEVIRSYTGSAGTKIPRDVQAELNSYKKLIRSKGKIKLQNR